MILFFLLKVTQKTMFFYQNAYSVDIYKNKFFMQVSNNGGGTWNMETLPIIHFLLILKKCHILKSNDFLEFLKFWTF